MPAYLCILEDGEDNSDGLEKVANVVCFKMNEYIFAKKIWAPRQNVVLTGTPV